VTANLPNGVIFDLDGTLVDSAADVAAILNKVLAEHQQALFSISEVKIMMGHGIRTTIEKALKARGRHFDAGVLDRWNWSSHAFTRRRRSLERRLIPMR
jgi:phosphoglycolate phosphatase